MIYVLILLLGAIMSIFGPWWIIAPIAIIISRLKANSGKQAFWQSALAMMTLWLGYSVYIHLNTDVSMVNKMAGVLTSSPAGLDSISNLFLIFGVITLLSLLIGGLSGLAGYSLKRI